MFDRWAMARTATFATAFTQANSTLLSPQATSTGATGSGGYGQRKIDQPKHTSQPDYQSNSRARSGSCTTEPLRTTPSSSSSASSRPPQLRTPSPTLLATPAQRNAQPAAQPSPPRPTRLATSSRHSGQSQSPTRARSRTTTRTASTTTKSRPRTGSSRHCRSRSPARPDQSVWAARPRLRSSSLASTMR